VLLVILNKNIHSKHVVSFSTGIMFLQIAVS